MTNKKLKHFHHLKEYLKIIYYILLSKTSFSKFRETTFSKISNTILSFSSGIGSECKNSYNSPLKNLSMYSIKFSTLI